MVICYIIYKYKYVLTIPKNTQQIVKVFNNCITVPDLIDGYGMDDLSPPAPLSLLRTDRPLELLPAW